MNKLDLLFALFFINGALATIDHLELVMPKYAVRGGDVILRCDHSVSLDQLYKVEWRKKEKKVFQYIKGRSPPFRFFPVEGAQFNKANSSEKQLALTNLDFEANGLYTCTVSMETPIFSQDSESRLLTIIEPQERDPVITFNKETYEIGEKLEANCTTAPSRPPPHVTWFINDEKVDNSLTKSFTPSWQGSNYFDQMSSSIKQLSIEVSELHVGDDGELRLTCMATIPGYVSHNEEYGDVRKHSVKIDIVLTENPAEPISNNDLSAGNHPRLLTFAILFSPFLLFL